MTGRNTHTQTYFPLKHLPAEAQKRVVAALIRVQRAENERINEESNSVQSEDKGDASFPSV